MSPLREIQTSGFRSPTANLPNYVVDGTSPRIMKFETKAKENKNKDWLTNHREKKQAVHKEVKDTLKGLKKASGGFSRVKSTKSVAVSKKIKLK